MNFHKALRLRSTLRGALSAGVLSGLLLCSAPPAAAISGQSIIEDQLATQQAIVQNVLQSLTGQVNTGTASTGLDELLESSSTSSSSGGASIPDIPQAEAVGKTVRVEVRTRLRSRCSQRCSNVLQSTLGTCDLSPSPQECSNRAQASYQLCNVQCN